MRARVGGNGHVPPREDKAPIPPPDHTIADVTLYDRPILQPSGAGNFWTLGMIGLAILVLAALIVLFIWVMQA
jgi:hypothetical protein